MKPILNLTSYSYLQSGNRDSLSLFFETNGDYSIRVHKVFFIGSEFDKLQKARLHPDAAIDAMDISDSVREVRPQELIDSLTGLISDRRAFVQDAAGLYRTIGDLVESHPQRGGLEDYESRARFVDDLNDVFYYYRYSLKIHQFVRDNTALEIERLLEEIPFSSERIDDSNEGNKPHLEDISPEEAGQYEFRVYNVGQASCSALIRYIDGRKSDYRVIAVFDMGFQKAHGKRNDKLDEMLHKVDEDTTIVISHFHQDHINNVPRYCGIKTKRWIFPRCNVRKHKAYKFFQALLLIAKKKTTSGTIYLFDTPYAFSKNLIIHQHLGKASDPYHLHDDVNAQSLVSELHIGRKRILIPGDALYEEYDTIDLSAPFDYVLLPHHGCKYFPRDPSMMGHKISKVVGPNTLGIVSCGSNPYGHANASHLSWYGNPYLFNGAKVYDDAKNPLRTSRVTRKDYYKITF